MNERKTVIRQQAASHKIHTFYNNSSNYQSFINKLNFTLILMKLCECNIHSSNLSF